MSIWGHFGHFFGTHLGGDQGRGPETGCNIEVRDRLKLCRAVVWTDGGFETTSVEPLTCLVGPVTVDFGTFWRNNFAVGLQVMPTLLRQKPHS